MLVSMNISADIRVNRHDFNVSFMIWTSSDFEIAYKISPNNHIEENIIW